MIANFTPPRAHTWLGMLLLVLLGNTARANEYLIDAAATHAGFEVWMFGFIPIRGTFKHTSGTLHLEHGKKSGSITLDFDTTSLVATPETAESIVRGSDFFDVKKYPHMRFQSSRFIFEGERLHAVEGELTLAAVTRTINFNVDHAKCQTDLEPPVCVAEGVFTVKRSIFGMHAWAHSVGDEVTIRIRLLARKNTPQNPPAPK